MSENLFILNGVLTATAGSAATAEPLPEANVDANGKVTVVQPGKTSNATSATDNTQTDAGTTAGDTTTSAGGSASGAQTGTTSEAGTETAGSAASQASGNTAVEGGTEATGTDAGMGGGEVGNMTGEAGMTGGGGAAMDGAGGMDGMGTETGASFSVTGSVPAMIGITAGVLALSILVGIVLAKLKIKKGINLYED